MPTEWSQCIRGPSPLRYFLGRGGVCGSSTTIWAPIGPKAVHCVADAIGWALVQSGIPLQLHYLDDFLFFIPPESTQSQLVLPHILHVLDSLGVPVAAQKIDGLVTTVTFLGITVDTARSELRLPRQKLEYIGGLVRSWCGRRSGRYESFESLIGHLAHASTVIRQGQIFLMHLYTTSASSRSHRHVHLDATVRADLL